jgi:hypothetical protein
LRFIDFLSEGDTVHRKELTEGKFLELLREKCKNSHVIATKIPFFRTDKGPDMMLVTPSAKEERSAFWIDKMIKEIPAWNKFPDRSRCIKAYNRYENVNDSNVYVVIPFDGSSVGIAKTESFYRSFDDVEKSIGFDRVDNDSFRKWIEHIFTGLGEILGEKFKTPPLESYSQFKKALSLIDKILERDRNDLKKKLSASEQIDGEKAKIVKDLLSRHVTNMEAYLIEKLDPEANAFSCTRIESYHGVRADAEIWIDKPCLLIKRNKYIELHKQGSL